MISDSSSNVQYAYDIIFLSKPVLNQESRLDLQR